MLFSVVVPVYNVEEYLDECIQSILQQVSTINNGCEILLINDGSTDSSGTLCDVYGEKYPNIVKVFHNQNQGLLATRRYGFKKASGEYIINCDSDDLIETKMFESVNEIIVKYDNPDIILINHYGYDGKNKTIRYRNIFSSEHDSVVSKNAVLSEYMSGYSIVSMWGKIIKKSCIDVDRDYTEYEGLNTGEDTLQSIEFFTNASTFVYLNEPLYDYRCESGMTAKFDMNYYFTFKKIFKQIEKENNSWKLNDFDKLFANKVLQMSGRAITQSRYNKWKSLCEQKQYLKSIRDDELFKNSICFIRFFKCDLQKSHILLLRMLKKNQLSMICVLLRLKNCI